MSRFDGVHAILLLSTWIRVFSKSGYVCGCWSVNFGMSLRQIWKQTTCFSILYCIPLEQTYTSCQ